MSVPKSHIRKYWFGIEDTEEIADFVLLMERDRIEQYKASLDITLNDFHGVFKGITGFLNNKKISVIYSIGPAHIVDCVNFLAYAFPVKKIISTGSIGGLSTEMGDIVISNYCATQDAFTSTIFMDEIQQNKILGRFVEIKMPNYPKISRDTIEKNRHLFNCKVHIGGIFTVPAVSMEDENRLKAIKNKGYIAVDLETGPFLAACRYNNIEGTCIHWVTDLPLERNFYYQYYGDVEKIEQDKAKKDKQWFNLPKIILSFVKDFQ